MHNNVLNYLYDIVKIKPDKLAYSDGEAGLTFSEVNERTARIGSFLAGKHIYKKPVVVFMKKSPEEITAFFGIIAGGCFYVPIDEEMPRGRIQLILDNVHTPLIICDETTIGIAEGFEAGDAGIILYEDLLATDTDEAALSSVYDKAIDTDPIYIVFTSGSTGIPKGVAACHRSVIDYIEQLSEVLGFNENTVFGNQTPLYFDACLKELYPTLKFGATTYLIPRECFSFPVKLVEYLNKHKINTICWVVSALTMISAFKTFDSVKPKYLKTIAFGSEVFPIKQFKLWREAVPEAAFTNLYGPTEGTGMCCYYRCDRDFADDEVIPIGRPFPNREILLLTEDGKPVPAGEPGEICVRGTSVTLGYYNDPERTAAAYVQNPLNPCYPEIIYRTGDIARYNEAGELIFVSRKDFQIKHMGHRIELGEIEVNVNMLPEIKLCACIYDTKRGKIVLFYVGDITEKDLILSLKGSLPRYMLPNRVKRLEEMPLTANGKIDRVSLKKM
ncbi:MAG: amino acid adenylation domain-containing protein [Clostridiales bacterium]|nr:amino acid adenylation domain-containing protein [Clostridiales bacterium]